MRGKRGSGGGRITVCVRLDAGLLARIDDQRGDRTAVIGRLLTAALDAEAGPEPKKERASRPVERPARKAATPSTPENVLPKTPGAIPTPTPATTPGAVPICPKCGKRAHVIEYHPGAYRCTRCNVGC